MTKRNQIRHPEVLSRPEEIAQLAAELAKHEIISFDTEFIRESTFFPMVEIIQVATENESWIVDAKALNRVQLKPLLDVFEDKRILKILHAAQGDQECVYTSFGVVATPTLDTAVAAALCGYGDNLGLANLLKSVAGVNLKKGHARTNWSVRPLPAPLLEYAHADVEHLVQAGQKLIDKLKKLGRYEWALEISAQWEDKKQYEPDPEGIAQRLAHGARLDMQAYAALIELVKWREARVRQVNVPRRWIADDTLLVDLARVRPKDMEHLSAFRGLNKGELKHSGQAILNGLARAAESTPPPLPQGKRHEIPSDKEARAADLLKCYLTILADEHQIAGRFLGTVQQIMAVIQKSKFLKAPEDLATQGLMSARAAELVGAEVLAFLNGKRALSVTAGEIKVVETP